MSIIASAPVPAGNRLIDADTADLAAIRREGTNQGRFPVNPPYAPQPSGDDRYAEGYADGLNRALTARPATCPAWCTHGHIGEVTEVDGLTVGTLHERVVAELTAQDPAYVDTPATALVVVEQSDEAGVVVDPARVVLSLTDGVEAHYPGSEGVQGWTGTPEQAEQLADALMVAAEMIRVIRRAGR